MDEKTILLELLNSTNIDGMNFAAGVARFGGNPKLYIKIIGTFTRNIGAHLEALRGLTEATLSDYAIKVHGVKGSCYGIDAVKVGKMAETQEVAAKAGRYDEVAAGNLLLIDAIYELVSELEALMEKAQSNDGVGGEKKEKPSGETLLALYEAACEFEVDAVLKALEELKKYSYENGADLIKWLEEKAENFAYGDIQERLKTLI